MRLVLISFLAPALVVGGTVAVWGIGFLAVAAVGYPIAVAATLLCIFPLHSLFCVRRLGSGRQMPLVLITSIAAGAAIYAGLFLGIGSAALSVRLLLEYCYVGALVGACTWLLYNFGPLSPRANAA